MAENRRAAPGDDDISGGSAVAEGQKEINRVSCARRRRDRLSEVRGGVSISSDRTTNLFPSSRCASTIQTVRPSESTAETHPKLQGMKVPFLTRIKSRLKNFKKKLARDLVL